MLMRLKINTVSLSENEIGLVSFGNVCKSQSTNILNPCLKTWLYKLKFESFLIIVHNYEAWSLYFHVHSAKQNKHLSVLLLFYCTTYIGWGLLNNHISCCVSWGLITENIWEVELNNLVKEAKKMLHASTGENNEYEVQWDFCINRSCSWMSLTCMIPLMSGQLKWIDEERPSAKTACRKNQSKYK